MATIADVQALMAGMRQNLSFLDQRVEDNARNMDELMDYEDGVLATRAALQSVNTSLRVALDASSARVMAALDRERVRVEDELDALEHSNRVNVSGSRVAVFFCSTLLPRSLRC